MARALLLMILFLAAAVAQAQRIGGNVYGGGNKGNVKGNATVTVQGVDSVNLVFGGARMANVGGRAFVNIDGQHATDNIFITSVFGGNDIAGTIGTADTIPSVLTEVIPEPTNEQLTATTPAKTREEWRADYKKERPDLNNVDNTWNAFVRSSRSSTTTGTGASATTTEDKWILVGSVYGGGNGEYFYDNKGETTTGTGESAVTKITYDVYNSEADKTAGKDPIATIQVDKGKDYHPVLGKTYLEIKGGELAHVYGGGNAATVTGNTTICINNESTDCDGYVTTQATKLWTADNSHSGSGAGDLETEGEHSWKHYYAQVIGDLQKMAKLNAFQSDITSFKFNHARVFGGNNRAEMSIRPTWNLQRGIIRDLYSGGNMGDMTSPEGLLLEINPYVSPDLLSGLTGNEKYAKEQEIKNKLSIHNVYGGSRMADVVPKVNGVYTPCSNLPGYHFPDQLAARVLVYGGDIDNVYGGNDITGKVYGGNAIGIYSSINGDVYGGGNGAYAYTDNATLGAMDMYKDFYYPTPSGMSSVEALNAYRPNAEQVSIRLAGTAPAANERPHHTIVKGSVYLGGNCATLATEINSPLVELKIGSYAIANQVFLGCNGEGMTKENTLQLYASNVKDGKVDPSGEEYSQIDLLHGDMSTYMEGVTMPLQPRIVFDTMKDDDTGDPANYEDYTSYVGSFFCGGNVGSMAVRGKNVYEINRGLNIFEKFVGGCNNAYVPASDYNAAHNGGVLGVSTEWDTNGMYRANQAVDGQIQDRLEINLANLTITPLRWKTEDRNELIWNTNLWTSAFALIASGTVLSEGDVYYTKEAGDEYERHVVENESITADGTQYEDAGHFEPVPNGEAHYSYPAIENGTTLTAGETYYTSDTGTGEFIAGGTEKADHTNHYYERVNDVRLLGGNVYGGCYTSGHVNGNVVININDNMMILDQVFGDGTGPYGNKASGVDLEDQRDDLLALAMTVFGAGSGKDTEVWGSATVNLNKGYTFQIFGGGEQGVVGKSIGIATPSDKEHAYTIPTAGEDQGKVTSYIFNGKVYAYNDEYSTNVNLKGLVTASDDDSDVTDLAETEYIFGAGNEGPVCGNATVNLGNGRIYDAFGGACDAFILGHAAVYIGRSGVDGDNDVLAFPWVRDDIYGGNDFGGKILGLKDYKHRLREGTFELVHGPVKDNSKDVLKANCYVEYMQGHVGVDIYGGCYGEYDYADPDYTPVSGRPDISSSFVHLHPVNINLEENLIGNMVFGGCEGHPQDREGDKMQDRSYVLVDIPDVPSGTDGPFKDLAVFGAGNNNGLGMNFDVDDTMANDWDPDQLSAIVDLVSGQVKNVYGGSYNEGITARTVVNVPSAIVNNETISSTIKVNSIFGGSYGRQILPPCDVYESNINYNSEDAYVQGAIYGGNNQERRTLYTHINIHSSVKSTSNWTGLATVYGAGRGIDTWSEYTEVNLNSGAKVHEVYGGGEMGHVLNAESVQKYMQLYMSKPSPQISQDDPDWSDPNRWNGGVGTGTLKTGKLKETDELTIPEMWAAAWKDAWAIGSYYKPNDDYTNYVANRNTNLTNDDLVTNFADDIDDRDYSAYEYADGDDADAKKAKDDAKARVFKRYNTNVRIKEGASVARYAYGGGLGDTGDPLSGDVYGTTYIALLGGSVTNDIYAAGTAGSVRDLFGAGAYDATIDPTTNKPKNPTGFTASATAYIEGGTVRNVYGGGWRGHVGHADYKDGTRYDVKDENDNLVTVYEQVPDFWKSDGTTTDILGETHVVIGRPEEDIRTDSLALLNGETHETKHSYYYGRPSITRNVYGGGEGGSIFGTAHVKINNGYIGFRFNPDGTDVSSTDIDERYEAEIHDKAGDRALEKRGGSVFGGGYVANSYVDVSDVKLYDGVIRGSLFGGGEIGPIGRGTMRSDATAPAPPYPQTASTVTFTNGDAKIYKGGETHLEMFGGQVMHSVFGGGRGKDNWDGFGYMTKVEEQTMDQSSRGYVFGSTDVRIHGGTIGTPTLAIQGYGNVFGGGDEGYVYSATGTKLGTRVSDEDLVNGMPDGGGGYYYVDSNKDGVFDTGEALTLDCHVTIEPYAKVTAADGISGFTAGDNVKASYVKGDYVPTAALNQLRNRTADYVNWANLDTRGIIIHNAAFAGGNAPVNSTVMSAKTVTVFGNAGVTLSDVYNYDLVTLGSDELGGLYGDGDLTLVDGFRELHVDNYGTDYYSLDPTMELNAYGQLTDRQKAYYQLRYVTKDEYKSNHTYTYYECKENHTYEYKKDGEENEKEIDTYKRGQKIQKTTFEDENGIFQSTTYNETEDLTKEQAYWVPGSKTFSADEQIDAGEWLLMDPTEQAKWVEFGVCSKYAGRPMNTVQRADFCGIWGSRMVMQGAQDRVSPTYNQTNYTINRVDEISLNKRQSVNTTDLTKKEDGTYEDPNAAEHGNYFGIYNVVNYLGNLTSDVRFEEEHDVRTTDTKEDNIKADGTTTYYQWKAANPYGKYRNNGTSSNKVALASGVFLEIKREETETAGEDKWGYITGVVELDLINVMTGMGGGYVYARNEHGTKEYHDNWGKVTLLPKNATARTYRHFTYTQNSSTDDTKLQPIETSGNFVHNVKQIVDDCYPNGGIYKDGYTRSPAHYWFIKGSVYVYEQYISAYTGSANAYAESVDIPLSISAASNGRLTLRDVQPNYYAYYDKNGIKMGSKVGSTVADTVFVANGITYKLNDPISYWQFRLLTEGEKAKFVEETYVTNTACKIGEDNTPIPAGYVMLPSEYSSLESSAQTGKLNENDPEAKSVKYVEDDDGKKLAFTDVFRPSNNLSHETGYILTYAMNNPMTLDNYYTYTKNATIPEANRLNTKEYNEKIGDAYKYNHSDYTHGPTYTLKSQADQAVYGQHTVKQGAIISKKVYTDYETNVKGNITYTYTAVADGTKLTAGKKYYTSNTGAGVFTATGSETADASHSYYTCDNEQAKLEEAYVVKETISVKDEYGHEIQQLNPGTAIVQSAYTPAQWTSFGNKVEPAKVSTDLLQFSETDYVYPGKVLTSAEISTLRTKVIALKEYVDDDNSVENPKTKEQKADDFLDKYMSDAYYCTETGMYGGKAFTYGQSYSSLETFNALPKAERNKFYFNYDALDLLIDPTYDGRLESHEGQKEQYDGTTVGTGDSQHYIGNNPKIYSAVHPIDYQAEWVGTDDNNDAEEFTYTPQGGTEKTITESAGEDYWLTREDFEALANEQRHFSPISITAPGEYYIAKEPLLRGDIPYGTGQTIPADVYSSMTDEQKKSVAVYTFTETHNPQKTDSNGDKLYKDKDGNETTEAKDGDDDNEPIYDLKTYYYCREGYTIKEKENLGVGFTTVDGITVKTYDKTTTSYETSDTEAVTYAVDQDVPQGVIIPEGTTEAGSGYKALPNRQIGFAIHGVSPTETSQLYVSSESDILDLSKEKIITVIYLYEYEESDESGMNIMPVSERHVVNIHINFKSGVPEIDKISEPDLVLPGTAIGMETPGVTKGAYNVTNYGWEVFSTKSEADTHTNGQTYYNNVTPVYWYQDGYYIAYFAETYLGKTYSNAVPFHVGNYHDLKKVMDDKEHHYYIDHQDVKQEPKIYINDYSKTNENGLDMFKNLIDLTYINQPKTFDDEGKPVTIGGDGPLKDHVPMDITLTHGSSHETMQGGEWLEFFMRSDIDHSSSDWTPIASGTNECFSGTLHGDGHHMSGMKPNLSASTDAGKTGSLFGHLCGSVYNLGVSGSFTGGGVADEGAGYVENCWVSTTGTLDGTKNAVFGNPTAQNGVKQIVNSYYPTGQNFNATEKDGHGIATAKPQKAFYNGEVAYDLNGFYLYKRYNDNTSTAADVTYKYWKSGETTPQDGSYADNITNATTTYCSSGYNGTKYVEERFADGDFRYAGGTIPDSRDARSYIPDEVNHPDDEYFYPIWPDDYLFFGQMLTYGHSDQAHDDLPTAIVRDNGLLAQNERSNRVYRAPAYFRNSKMGVAHFNPNAYLAQQSADGTKEAYPGMTAIDFKGHYWNEGVAGTNEAGTYGLGNATGWFYTPLLDDDGLLSIRNVDETKNLLVYAPSEADNATTHGVLTGYFTEPAYSTYNSGEPSAYRLVGDATGESVRGHLVQSNLTSIDDHYLVDKQDFDAPIAYDFNNSTRMWYQRKPELFVDRSKGWEGISLPFTAELVTTNQKGEITHFFNGSLTSKNDTGTKIGHEYWLRDYKGGLEYVDADHVVKANLSYPSSAESDYEAPVGGTKDDIMSVVWNKTGQDAVTNTFLWDYYYKENNRNRKDANNDEYQTYYNSKREFTDYPLLTQGLPYIIGFPGVTYYEFDLSGSFTASNTATPITKLDPQVITFASATGTSINVSDAEKKGVTYKETNTQYTFRPSYLNETLTCGDVVENGITSAYFNMNSDGNAFYKLSNVEASYTFDNGQTYADADDFAAALAAAGTLYTAKDINAIATSWADASTTYYKLTSVTPSENDQHGVTPSVLAFRPYFISTLGGSNVKRETRAIVFSDDDSDLGKDEEEVLDKPGELIIRTRERKIYVTSTLSKEANVTIVNAAGALINTYKIQPGETIVTEIHNPGIYLVNKTKLSIK